MKITRRQLVQIIREDIKRNLLESRYRPVSDYPIGINMKDAPGSSIIEDLQKTLGFQGSDVDGMFGPATAEALEELSGYRDVLSSNEMLLVNMVAEQTRRISGPQDPLAKTAIKNMISGAFTTLRQGRRRAEDMEIDIEGGIESLPEPGEETEPRPGEGTIDGMSITDWMVTYWTTHPSPHGRKYTIDLRVTDNVLKVLQTARKYIVYRKILDETYSRPVNITDNPSYNASPGGDNNAHYHIEFRGLTSEGQAALRNAPSYPSQYIRQTSSWPVYVNELTQDGQSCVRLLGLVAKELQEAGESIGRIVITSAYRSPPHQTRTMISNWNKKGGGASGTRYLVGLYADDQMAKALGLALQGGTVVTTAGEPGARSIALATVDMGSGPVDHNDHSPRIA